MRTLWLVHFMMKLSLPPVSPENQLHLQKSFSLLLVLVWKDEIDTNKIFIPIYPKKNYISLKKIEKWEIRKDKQSPRLKEKCSLSFSLWNTRLREGNPCSLVKSLNRLLVRDTDHHKSRFTMKCSAAFYYLTKVWSLHSAAHWDKEKGLWGNCPSPEIQFIWFGASIN